MKTSWTQGLDEQLKKDVRGDFKSSLLTRNRLTQLLLKKIEVAETTSLDKEGYDTANWAFKQADIVGYKRAMREVIDLITDDTK